MEITLYHNPRCSKSRATLALIENHGVPARVVEYLDQAPDVETLENILTMLQMGPRDLMRKSEAAYADNGLGDASLSDQQLIAAMVANPILIERPIVVAGDQARIGRPPESVLEILP